MPVLRVGKMVLNRNPDNFFAENEQAAFHPGHIVPGIDFSNDPLLQGASSLTPIRKLAAWVGRTSMKSPSTVQPARFTISSATGCTGWTLTPIRPTMSPTPLTTTGRARRRQRPNAAALSPSPSASTAKKIRQRSPSFGEYYAQPRLFWLSQTPIEQQHIIDGFSFELSKVVRTWIRERVVDHLAHIDTKLAEAVGANLGIELSDDQRNITLPSPVNGVEKDPSLSLYADAEGGCEGRVVAVLLNERTSAQDLVHLLQALQAQGVHSKLLYSRMGEVIADDGSPRRSPAPSPVPHR